MQINLLMKQEIHAATVLTAFSWSLWKQTSTYVKKCRIADESWQPRNIFQVLIGKMWNEILGNHYKCFAIKVQRPNIYFYTKSYKTQMKRMSSIKCQPKIIL